MKVVQLKTPRPSIHLWLTRCGPHAPPHRQTVYQKSGPNCLISRDRPLQNHSLVQCLWRNWLPRSLSCGLNFDHNHQVSTQACIGCYVEAICA